MESERSKAKKKSDKQLKELEKEDRGRNGK